MIDFDRLKGFRLRDAATKNNEYTTDINTAWIILYVDFLLVGIDVPPDVTTTSASLTLRLAALGFG